MPVYAELVYTVVNTGLDDAVVKDRLENIPLQQDIQALDVQFQTDLTAIDTPGHLSRTIVVMLGPVFMAAYLTDTERGLAFSKLKTMIALRLPGDVGESVTVPFIPVP